MYDLLLYISMRFFPFWHYSQEGRIDIVHSQDRVFPWQANQSLKDPPALQVL
jgi:hypothetical protein